MGQVGAFLRKTEDGYAHWCPACRELHNFSTLKRNSSNALWEFNNDFMRPSFVPSMNIRADFALEDGGPDVCHYFLQDGRLSYLGDCTHAFRNCVITLPPLPEHLTDNYQKMDS